MPTPKPNICPICRTRPASGKNRICDSPICREEMKKSWYESSIAIPEGFISVAEYAKRKGISVQAVAKNCRAGKYPDAFQDPRSGRWYISEEGAKITGFIEAADRRRTRPFRATNDEWTKIVEAAALTKYSVHEYLIRKALDKKI